MHETRHKTADGRSQSIDLVETGAGVRSGPLSATRERGPDLNLVFPHTRPRGRGRGRHSYNQLWPLGVRKVTAWCAQSGYVNSFELLR